MFNGMDFEVTSAMRIKLSMSLCDMLIPSRGDIPIQPARVGGFGPTSGDGHLRDEFKYYIQALELVLGRYQSFPACGQTSDNGKLEA